MKFRQITAPKGAVLTEDLIIKNHYQHKENVARHDMLYRYYINDITGVVTSDNPLVPSGNVPVANGYYITTVANGFTFANPITYSGVDVGNLVAFNKRAKVASHDAELGEDLSIYGVGYELIHKDSESQTQIMRLDPRNTFLCLEQTLEKKVVYGQYAYLVADDKGESYEELNVYTETQIDVYKLEKGKLTLLETRTHQGGEVPIVMYYNNTEAMGDFERVIDLIDAYNTLTTQRMIDKEQFIDAILVLYNAQLLVEENEESKAQVMEILRRLKVLELPDGAKAEYLKKTLDESNIEVLKKAIANDIAKFSLVPDIMDDSFISNTSGVAMAYKTLPLQWLANVKKRMFEQSLGRRLRIVAHYESITGNGFDWENVTVRFNPTLPINAMEFMPYGKELLSKQTLVAYLAPIFGVENVEEELSQRAEEDGRMGKL